MFLGMSQAEADASGWRGSNEGGMLRELALPIGTVPNTGLPTLAAIRGVWWLSLYQWTFHKSGLQCILLVFFRA